MKEITHSILMIYYYLLVVSKAHSGKMVRYKITIGYAEKSLSQCCPMFKLVQSCIVLVESN